MNKQVTRGNERKAQESQIEKQKAFDDVKVTGRFHNVRHPGSSVKLPYVKYSTDPAVWHTFHHGKVYTIPEEVLQTRLTIIMQRLSIKMIPINPLMILINLVVH